MPVSLEARYRVAQTDRHWSLKLSHDFVDMALKISASWDEFWIIMGQPFERVAQCAGCRSSGYFVVRSTELVVRLVQCIDVRPTALPRFYLAD